MCLVLFCICQFLSVIQIVPKICNVLSDFSFSSGSPTPIFSLTVHGLCLNILLVHYILCCTITFIAITHIFNFFFCVTALFFPQTVVCCL